MVIHVRQSALQVFQAVFNAAETLSLVRRYSVTSLIAVPAMVVSLLEASQAEQLMQPHQATGHSRSATGQQFSKARSSRRRVSTLAAYPSVRLVLLGGGELPARLKRPLQALFPSAHLYTAYGMTEACSSMTFASLDVRPSTATSFRSSQAATGPAAAADSTADPGAPLGKPAHQSSSGDMAGSGSDAGRHESSSGAGAIPVGWPPPGIELAIAPLAADGSSSRKEIFFGKTPAGEVLTRGPHVMLGYWGDPEATRAAQSPGGWLRTGDVGRVDARGCLLLLGRIKDIVRSGGENVNAAAVERVLLQVGFLCQNFIFWHEAGVQCSGGEYHCRQMFKLNDVYK